MEFFKAILDFLSANNILMIWTIETIILSLAIIIISLTIEKKTASQKLFGIKFGIKQGLLISFVWCIGLLFVYSLARYFGLL